MQQNLHTDHKALKPILKWAGGKRWLVPVIEPIWESHCQRRLVEPLCGGLAVSLGLMPKRALLNDINRHLCNFYRWVKKGLIVEIPMKNDRQLYYQHRERFNSLIDQDEDQCKEAAELFYYLNRTGYNGLCRFNKQGKFNVPFGRYTRINYQYDFLPYRNIFASWDFSCVDFEELNLDNDDLVYADPPYDVCFTQYYEKGFNWEDQVRFGHWLTGHPGPIILSNQATDRIIELYNDLDFEIMVLEAPRLISSNGSRIPAREVLALKNI